MLLFCAIWFFTWVTDKKSSWILIYFQTREGHVKVLMHKENRLIKTKLNEKCLIKKGDWIMGIFNYGNVQGNNLKVKRKIDWEFLGLSPKLNCLWSLMFQKYQPECLSRHDKSSTKLEHKNVPKKLFFSEKKCQWQTL